MDRYELWIKLHRTIGRVPWYRTNHKKYFSMSNEIAVHLCVNFSFRKKKKKNEHLDSLFYYFIDGSRETVRTGLYNTILQYDKIPDSIVTTYFIIRIVPVLQ